MAKILIEVSDGIWKTIKQVKHKSIAESLILKAVKNGKEIKQGVWIPCIDKDGTPTLEEYYGIVYECSICHFRDLKSDYCCNCGAEMAGDTEESDAEFMCKAMSKTINKSTDDRNFIGGF